MADRFDWRNPDFSARLLGDDVTPQQRVRRYVQRAPKRKLKKKPRTNYGSYEWEDGVTFEQKARALANMGVLGRRRRKNLFLDDFDTYLAPTEEVMEMLRNASSHEQKYYGVYDDLHPATSQTPPPARQTSPRAAAPTRLNNDGMSFNKAFAAARRAGLSEFNWRGRRYNTQLAGSGGVARGRGRGVSPAVMMPPSIEPEPLVSREPLDTMDTTARPGTEWNAVNEMALAQAGSALRRLAMQPNVNVPLTGVNGYACGGRIFPYIVI